MKVHERPAGGSPFAPLPDVNEGLREGHSVGNVVGTAGPLEAWSKEAKENKGQHLCGEDSMTHSTVLQPNGKRGTPSLFLLWEATGQGWGNSNVPPRPLSGPQDSPRQHLLSSGDRVLLCAHLDAFACLECVLEL